MDAVFDAALKRLMDATILVALTRGSRSPVESCVPDKVYILNPDRADEFDANDTGK